MRGFTPRESMAPYRIWGEHLEPDAVRQLQNACRLPVAVAGALMPDAHVGYGLPIGGVLATENAVIPYAVGVDIACRMKLTVLDLPVDATWSAQRDRLTDALERETRFGVGGGVQASAAQHDVMDADWSVTPVTTAAEGPRLVATRHQRQRQPLRRVRRADGERRRGGARRAGRTSRCSATRGSRGTGAEVAAHYSKLARQLHPELPQELARARVARPRYRGGPGVLGGDGADGPLRGGQPRAHSRVDRAGARRGGAARRREPPQLRLEGDAPPARRVGREVIVHRKGATPAGQGVLGIIPGSMASPGFVVRGKGSTASLLRPRTAPAAA